MQEESDEKECTKKTTILKVYLAGAIDKLVDLGTLWRVRVSRILLENDLYPVWPFRLKELADGKLSKETASILYRSDPQEYYLQNAELMLYSDVSLIRISAGVGSGTTAEYFACRNTKLPYVIWLVEEKGKQTDLWKLIISTEGENANICTTIEDVIEEIKTKLQERLSCSTSA